MTGLPPPYSKRYLDANLAVLMGGRIAEEIFLSEITTGAGNDIERATNLARRMVCEWGMSDLGPATFGRRKRPSRKLLERETLQG